jgi:hypothetical protein
MDTIISAVTFFLTRGPSFNTEFFQNGFQLTDVARVGVFDDEVFDLGLQVGELSSSFEK